MAKNATSLVYDLGLQELQNIGVSVMDTDECIAWLGESYSKFNTIRKTKCKKIEKKKISPISTYKFGFGSPELIRSLKHINCISAV